MPRQACQLLRLSKTKLSQLLQGRPASELDRKTNEIKEAIRLTRATGALEGRRQCLQCLVALTLCACRAPKRSTSRSERS